MVRNKSSGGHPDMTGRTKKTGSRVKSSKASTLADEPDDSETPAAAAAAAAPETASQLVHSDKIYLLASVIFQNNHREKAAAYRLVNYGKERGLPLPEVKDRVMQRRAYELAFNTLKYDQMSLVAVMLFDFQDRRFLPRERQEQESIQEVRDVENYLLRFKTKLAASLARCRIKHDLLSIECILPESVRKKQQRSSCLPLYAWVNTLKSSLDEVQGVLKSDGFFQVQSIGQLEGRTFCQDLHCGDTLVFPAQLKAQLHSSKLLSEHKLIIQDKSCSLGPNAACSLLPEEGDILVVGCFSGLTVFHTAALIAEKHKGGNTVYVCVSECTDAQREELQLTVSTMGCNNVKLIPEVFRSLNSGDKRLLKVRVILVNPRCSVSAISNPVEFILQENGDPDLLQGLSQGSIAQSKLEALVARQREDIDHALKFPRVLAVVYSTCSSYPEENVDVVSKALQQANTCLDQEGEPKKASFRLSSFPLTSSDQTEFTEETQQFFTLEPSNHNNGCFLAILKREPEPVVKAAPQDIIARANAKGILDRISCSHRTKKDQQGQTNRMKKGSKVCMSQPNLSISMAFRKQPSKSCSGAILCGHKDAANKLQSLKGNPKPASLQSQKSTVPNTLSISKPKGTSYFSTSSSAQPESSTPTKSSTPVLKATTDITIPTTPPSAPPASPVDTVVHPRRTHQEVLKPVVLVLPRVNFPNFFPHNRRQTGLSGSLGYTNWKTPAKIESLSHSHSPGGLYTESVDKSRSQF